MTDRVHARLLVLAVLVMSLVATLAARAFSLQVVAADEARAAAQDNRERELVIPAARGMILDQQGRPLATNRISLDVAVDRRELARLDDDGQAVLARLADLLGMPPSTLTARLQNCGTVGAQPQPNCWNGPPGAAPVVRRDVGIEVAGQVMADPDGFASVQVQRTPVREYPGGSLAAHTVGHVGAVTAEDLAGAADLEGVEELGKAGLEQVYDDQLRGEPGREQVTVDSAGHRSAGGVLVPATPGQTLVVNIDAQLQAAVEEQLKAAMLRARERIDSVSKRPFEADGGAAVVLDVRTGAVLALASAPDFDANIWSGGISSKDYARLTDPAAGQPLLNRAIQTAMAPASTFKAISTLVALDAGYSTTATYACPSSYRAGGRAFQNYRSLALGDITLNRALELSCDTIFYRMAHEQWLADGGSEPVPGPADRIARTAAEFGFGRPTGIDLPAETGGMLASRQAKQEQWEARHDEWCQRAEQGYPELADRERARFLTKLATENCTEGMRWRVGDALNAAIGQGDTAATVLQVATAYAAIANGGTVHRPQVARALLDPDGTVAATFDPDPVATVDVPAGDLAFLRSALRGVIDSGTARGAFEGFPTDTIPLAGKTGTGEVYGRQATSWFASFAPADDPRYAVVMMVSQAGTGAWTAGVGVKGIYEAIFGVVDGVPDPSRSVLAGGDVATALPTFGPDGLPVPPGAATRSGSVTTPMASFPSTQAASRSATVPAGAATGAGSGGSP